MGLCFVHFNVYMREVKPIDEEVNNLRSNLPRYDIARGPCTCDKVGLGSAAQGVCKARVRTKTHTIGIWRNQHIILIYRFHLEKVWDAG